MRRPAWLYSTVTVLIVFVWTLASTEVQANCRGCCSHHGGLVCVDQVTQCHDGSPLSAKCSSKGCNKCGVTAKPKQKSSASQTKSYDRKLYRHWVDQDGDCQNTRTEVLILTSEVKPKFKTDKQCVVVSGRWTDPYSGKVIYNASEIDIDHVVPIKHAHGHGAATWSNERREQFANDPLNLIPVGARENRKKGAKDPVAWLPPNQNYRCTYLQKWTAVKNKYGLTEPERSPASVSELMATVCKKPKSEPEHLKQTKPE